MNAIIFSSQILQHLKDSDWHTGYLVKMLTICVQLY